MFKEFINKIHKKNINRSLNKKQEEVNRLYAENGLTDEVLDKQLEINRIRHIEDVTDTSQIIHEEFVQ